MKHQHEGQQKNRRWGKEFRVGRQTHKKTLRIEKHTGRKRRNCGTGGELGRKTEGAHGKAVSASSEICQGVEKQNTKKIAWEKKGSDWGGDKKADPPWSAGKRAVKEKHQITARWSGRMQNTAMPSWGII